LLLEFELYKTGLRYGAEHYPHSTSVISTTLFMLNKILYKGTTYKTVKYITRRPFQNTYNDISLQVIRNYHFYVLFLIFSDDKQQWGTLPFNLLCLMQNVATEKC